MKTTNHLPILCNRGKQFISMSVLTCAIALFSSIGVHADQTDLKAPSKIDKAKAPSKVTKPAVAKAPMPSTQAAKKVAVTGSRIPRAVKPAGHVKDTFSPVYIVDRKEIERSGATTTVELLRRMPFVR